MMQFYEYWKWSSSVVGGGGGGGFNICNPIVPIDLKMGKLNWFTEVDNAGIFCSSVQRFLFGGGGHQLAFKDGPLLIWEMQGE